MGKTENEFSFELDLSITSNINNLRLQRDKISSKNFSILVSPIAPKTTYVIKNFVL